MNKVNYLFDINKLVLRPIPDQRAFEMEYYEFLTRLPDLINQAFQLTRSEMKRKRPLSINRNWFANTNIGFSVKHTGSISNVVVPEIGQLVKKFMDNEFYSLHKKFEVMAEKPIRDLNEFVMITCEELKLFNYQSSEKNPNPSMNARIVIDTIKKEANLLKVNPNLWLGYNAFNEILHGKLKKSFEAQKKLDGKLFNTILEMTN